MDSRLVAQFKRKNKKFCICPDAIAGCKLTISSSELTEPVDDLCRGSEDHTGGVVTVVAGSLNSTLVASATSTEFGRTRVDPFRAVCHHFRRNWELSAGGRWESSCNLHIEADNRVMHSTGP